jgi:AraC-like DNA-binding protein
MPSLMRHSYRSVRFGVETLPDHQVLRPRHRHGPGYATVVLAGNFIEWGFAGRMVARAGDVLLHGRFDCHADAPQGLRPIQILRLPWDDDLRDGHFVTGDPDRLAQIAERDPYEAMRILAHELGAVGRREQHWTDALAVRLASPAKLSLRHWATDRGLRPEELSRGFRCTFGVSPKRFRLEVRARRAWGAVVTSYRALTDIAQDYEFADLAHMSRSIRALTGQSPTAWRNQRPAEPLAQVRSS